ncbi:RNA-directed DNA polymerase, eukaryota, reverse transcriptase zinc-binding domain protein, partial [Tanacetum coccineum]
IIKPIKSSVTSLCVTSNDNIIVGCFDGMKCKIDMRTRRERKSYYFRAPVMCMCLGDNDEYVLANCMDSTIGLVINVVLASMQVYWASVFILPKTVVRDIDRLL